MNNVLLKSFGGLTASEYLRHLFFGSLVFAVLIMPALDSDKDIPSQVLVFGILSTLLYPYSRYVYERIIGFIIGKNTVFANIVVLGIAKAITISFCWFFAIFGAPIGLLWLFFSRQPISAKSDEGCL